MERTLGPGCGAEIRGAGTDVNGPEANEGANDQVVEAPNQDSG